jgi:mycothiol system anti-sigma-R factor
MTCQELDRLLYPYLDGEFQPEERMDVETHLETCAECARRVEKEREIQQTLRRAARHSVQSSRAPQSLRTGIQVGLRREQRRASQFQWLRMSAAALVVVAVGGGWIALRPEERQRFVEDAAKRYAKRLPYEIANVGPEHVEAWFKGKLDHHVSLPALPHTQISGARLSNVDNRPAAYISYETRPEREGEEARRIALFVFEDARRDLDAQALPALPVDSPALKVDSVENVSVVIWREEEIVYELVSDMNEADIRKLLLDKQRAARVSSTPRSTESVQTVSTVSQSQ